MATHTLTHSLRPQDIYIDIYARTPRKRPPQSSTRHPHNTRNTTFFECMSEAHSTLVAARRVRFYDPIASCLLSNCECFYMFALNRRENGQI